MLFRFLFPYDRDYDLLRLQMEKMMAFFGVSWDQVLAEKQRLDIVRSRVWELDRLTWEEDRVAGWENHYYQICCSDFNGDPDKFAVR